MQLINFQRFYGCDLTGNLVSEQVIRDFIFIVLFIVLLYYYKKRMWKVIIVINAKLGFGICSHGTQKDVNLVSATSITPSPINAMKVPVNVSARKIMVATNVTIATKM